jgi:hypothetical protein
MKTFAIILVSSLFIFVSCAGSKSSKKTDKKDTIKTVTIVTEYNIVEKPDFEITNATFQDSVLTIDVKYVGGCGTHNFDLQFNKMYAKSLPLKAMLNLSHKAENETCSKQISETLKYNISNIQYAKKQPIVFGINGTDKKFTYNY